MFIEGLTQNKTLSEPRFFFARGGGRWLYLSTLGLEPGYRPRKYPPTWGSTFYPLKQKLTNSMQKIKMFLGYEDRRVYNLLGEKFNLNKGFA